MFKGGVRSADVGQGLLGRCEGCGDQAIGAFPWRCNLLRFWEAELKGGEGAGGAGERRGFRLADDQIRHGAWD